MTPSIAQIRVLCGLGLLVAVGLRFLHLDADPSFWMDRDFITDEAWWAHNPRNKVLFNQWILDEHNISLFTAPVYAALQFVVFQWLGTDFWTIRLLPALSGALTVVVFYAALRDVLSPRARLLAAGFVALDHTLVMHARVNLVESTLLLFFMITLYAWYRGRTHRLAYVAAGVSLAIMLLTKATSVYLLSGFLALVVVDRLRRRTGRHAMSLVAAGALAVLVPAGLLALGLVGTDWWRLNLNLGTQSELLNALSLTTHVLGLGTFLHNPVFGTSPLPFALGAVALAKLVSRISWARPGNALHQLTDAQVLALSVIVGNAIPLLLTLASPVRRFLIFVPALAILAAELVDARPSSRSTPPQRSTTPVAWLLALWLLYAFGLLILLRFPGLMWVWAGLCGVMAVLLVWLRDRARTLASGLVRVAGTALVVLPATLWAHRLSFPAGWQLGGGPGTSREGFAVLFAPLLLCPFLLPARWRRRAADWLLSPAGAVILAVAVNLGPALTWLVTPTYTLTAGAAALAQVTTPGEAVLQLPSIVVPTRLRTVVVRGGGVNGNPFERFRLSYVAHLSRDEWGEEPPLFAGAGPIVRRIGLCPAPWNPSHYRFILELRQITAPVPKLQQLLGQAYEWYGLWEDAAREYERALAQEPENVELRTRLEQVRAWGRTGKPPPVLRGR